MIGLTNSVGPVIHPDPEAIMPNCGWKMYTVFELLNLKPSIDAAQNMPKYLSFVMFMETIYESDRIAVGFIGPKSQ